MVYQGPGPGTCSECPSSGIAAHKGFLSIILSLPWLQGQTEAASRNTGENVGRNTLAKNKDRGGTAFLPLHEVTSGREDLNY